MIPRMAGLLVALMCSALLMGAEQPLKPVLTEAQQQFQKTLTKVKFIGHFTLTGDKKPPAEEEYTILSVEKLAKDDLWLFRARVKYGKTDLTLPMPLPVKWAGNTPVITLENITLPGLGTFSARVVVDGDKYAGTWSHGKVGGHLFGIIEKLDPK